MTALGTVAGIFSILGYVPYLWSIVRDRDKPVDDATRARPKRASWIIWFTTSWIILATMTAQASSFAIYQSWAYALGATFTLILAVPYGAGGWTRWDRVALAAALLGLALWAYFHSAWFAFAIAMSIDASGTLPILKARGAGESPVAWTLFLIGSLANVTSVLGLDDLRLTARNPHLADIVYPFGMTLIVLIPTVLSWRARRRVAAAGQRPVGR